MGFAVSRLKERYDKEIRPRLLTERGYRNLHMVPRIAKVILNVGVGEGKDEAKAIESAVMTLETITGQKPVITQARKSVSNFKIRRGMNIGCMVTLRGHVMWHFLDKLVSVVLPRVRDFQGVSVKSFDGHGNYSLGLRDQLVFAEIVFDDIASLKGMQITVVTTADNDVEAAHLLAYLGMPFNDFETVAQVA
ncbi:50S ribosomal protein L5 [bacterium]|nr:50S ribosomal protein L5 [bacterium]